MIGIVTDRDLAVRVVGASRDATNTLVSDVMTPDPVACRPEDDVDKTVEVMSKRQIRRIPIINDIGKVIGIISQADVAIRLNNQVKTGHMIGEISQPDLVPSPTH